MEEGNEVEGVVPLERPDWEYGENSEKLLISVDSLERCLSESSWVEGGKVYVESVDCVEGA